ncbi:hypothetical protein [uncultured Parasphingopyxis sp.]|uniref:hypothetical protein n=1 Tax=uncultured Parasphingopyxis sp. TaxID=1547918 RepID=UPI002613A0F7|nr:hypothetical protein [uncultured Parasphingopyxis sp.]
MTGAIANAATRTALSGGAFADNLFASIPDVIGNTIGSTIAQGIAAASAQSAREGDFGDVQLSGHPMLSWFGGISIDDITAAYYETLGEYHREHPIVVTGARMSEGEMAFYDSNHEAYAWARRLGLTGVFREHGVWDALADYQRSPVGSNVLSLVGRVRSISSTDWLRTVMPRTPDGVRAPVTAPANAQSNGWDGFWLGQLEANQRHAGSYVQTRQGIDHHLGILNYDPLAQGALFAYDVTTGMSLGGSDTISSIAYAFGDPAGRIAQPVADAIDYLIDTTPAQGWRDFSGLAAREWRDGADWLRDSNYIERRILAGRVGGAGGAGAIIARGVIGRAFRGANERFEGAGTTVHVADRVIVDLDLRSTSLSFDTPHLGGFERTAGTLQANAGPVRFATPQGATLEEIAQIQAYVSNSNNASLAGSLSPTGRVSTEGALRIEASRQAALERARAEAAGAPYIGHAGHVPDTTWTGNPRPHSWMDLTPRVNSSLGGQAARYPVGYRPTMFIFE